MGQVAIGESFARWHGRFVENAPFLQWQVAVLGMGDLGGLEVLDMAALGRGRQKGGEWPAGAGRCKSNEWGLASPYIRRGKERGG